MKFKGLRWGVITLIALATVINYIDRQALPVLWPDMAEELYPDKTADERKVSTHSYLPFSFSPMPLGRPFLVRFSTRSVRGWGLYFLLVFGP